MHNNNLACSEQIYALFATITLTRRARVLELEEAAEASGAQHEAEKAELAAAAESQRQVLEQRLEEVGRCGVVSGWVETRDGKLRNM